MRHTVLGFAALILLFACGEEDDDTGADAAPMDATAAADTAPTPEPIEIAGRYLDDFGGAHTIDDETWRQGEGEGASTFILLQVDNETDFAIARNGPDNAFSPDLFSRFDWTEDADGLWFCQTAFDAASEAAAAAVPAAEPSDPANTGCGGFAWSALTPQ